MPSRPVLIGRGLVPTTYKNTHNDLYDTHPRTRNEQPRACSRPLGSSQPTHPSRAQQQLAGGVDKVERVTAAIAKRETPGPIPNPEVKPFSADGTATERLWESRTPPDIHCESGVTLGWPHFCVPWARSGRRTAVLVGHGVSTGVPFSGLSTGEWPLGEWMSAVRGIVWSQEVHCDQDTAEGSGRHGRRHQ